MADKVVDVAVIIPDASPVITLARIDRLDLFETFATPIQIVDQVQYEITKPANDPDGKVAAWLARMGNQIAIVETTVGFGFRTKLERGKRPGAATSVRSRWMNMQHSLRWLPHPRSCRSYCLRTLMSWKLALLGCRECTF